MFKKVYYIKKDIRNVTEVYYNIIFAALRNNGADIIGIEELKPLTRLRADKDDFFIVTGMLSFLLIYLKGYRNFIFWFQGIAPEEVYLTTKSRWRRIEMSLIERFALRKCKYKIGVSKYQFNHFEKKYKINFDWEKVFIMPCFNSKFSPEMFSNEEKYKKDIFCYAGGMQAWQGFDDILSLYSKIEKKNDKAFLKILSKELDIARKKIENYNIKNYSLDYVPQERVSAELAECKYGFIIREDIIINNVATPTKLAAYVGNGIIPIFTSAIHFYRDLAKEYKYLCCIGSPTDVEPILKLMEMPINPVELQSEYRRLFDDHFTTSKYIAKLTNFFKR